MKQRRKIARGIAATTLGVLGAAAASTAVKRPESGPTGKERPTRTGMQARDAVIDESWDLPAVKNDRVDFFIEFLTTQKRDEMHTWLERLGRYGPLLQGELEARGMPQDLVYLALIESGFDPRAYSHADASGIWQFIEETGRRYGLRIDEWVDERNDPVAATGAALDYLQELHGRFGSWFLAAAAYNTGENRVERILRERLGTARASDDAYWEISPELPRETRDYVPLMLAAAHIAKDPARYGFEDLRFEAPLEYDEVRVPPRTPLKRVAEAARTPVESVRALNPHLMKRATPPGRQYAVRVPTGHGEAAAERLGGPAGGERSAR